MTHPPHHPIGNGPGSATLVSRALRLLLGGVLLVWGSWTLAFLCVMALDGGFTVGLSWHDYLESYFASLPYLTRPGLELATMTQLLAAAFATVSAAVWWSRRGRRQPGRTS